MVFVIVLLCASGLAPADCTEATAIDVIRLANESDELACMRTGMLTVASLAIKADEQAYWKFVCARKDADPPTDTQPLQLDADNPSDAELVADESVPRPDPQR